MIKNKKINRIFHTWDKWECYPAGFYASSVDGLTADECKEIYRDFLSSLVRFEWGLMKVITQWKKSCEHYLTNENMNRIAWLGQAALCIEHEIPQKFRSGFFLLTKTQQDEANQLALVYLNKWLIRNGYEPVNIDDAGINSKADIY